MRWGVGGLVLLLLWEVGCGSSRGMRRRRRWDAPCPCHSYKQDYLPLCYAEASLEKVSRPYGGGSTGS
ncbi:MAG: hypothetical protein NZ580_05940 [Bacteroidia bacterium]|nr:hypothetical protein [Bacteroidia bacterium]MDW8236417.1 hypothetical protein [Bacteroidia bacterium]